MMIDREKVIKGLEYIRDYDPMFRVAHDDEFSKYAANAIALLKAQEQATIEPKCIDLPDETKAWLDKMDAVDALRNIADICMDWDGYRTANGLGALVNKIWAYARYCTVRLIKEQGPIEPCTERDGRTTFFLCGSCNKPLCIAKDSYKPKCCPECGRKVKWE